MPCIDIHAHYFPREYLEVIARSGAGHGVGCDLGNPAGPVLTRNSREDRPLEPRFWDLEARLASMDQQGVDVHALSLTSPMVYWAPPELGLELSAAFNDAAIAAHRLSAKRFVALAMLPMQAPDLALRELERVAGNPAIRGVYMATQIDGHELSHEDFFPVYEAIARLRLEPARLRAYYLTNLIGNPTESAIAASHLIFGGVLDRFPELDVCLPHAGGSFPYLIGRITHGWRVRPETRHLKTAPDEYLRRFHYDTITHAHPALAYLIGLVGADRVVLGSDFCFDMSCERPVEMVMEHPGLTESERGLILGGNAARLLAMD